MGSAVILLSGGIDSAACIAYMQSLVSSVEGIFVDYLQPARESEREAACRVAKHYGVPLHVVETTAAPAVEGEILGRNAFLIFSALMAKPRSAGFLVLGIHAGTPYYDCSGPFANDIQRVLDGYSGGKIQLSVPFLSWQKSSILEFCREHRVPLEITWSCESRSHQACGRCESCKDRALLNVSETN